MKSKRVFGLIGALIAIVAVGFGAASIWEGGGGRSPLREYVSDTTLRSAGVDPIRLRAAVEFAMDEEKSTRGLVILQNGELIAEAYEGPEARTDKHVSFSVAKSFSSALVGIAIGDGLLSLDDPVCKFYEEWDCSDEADPRRKIKLRHLLTLTSGLDWHEDWGCPMSRARLLFRDSDAVYMDLALFKTPAEYVLHRPAKHEPGEHFAYSTGDPALISRILEGATGVPFFEYAKQRLFGPLGIEEVEWTSDDDGHTRNYAHLHMKTRDFAKLGQLYLQGGAWQGEQVVPAEWVHESTDPKSGPSPWYGYLWHVNLPVKFDRPQTSIPKDAFMARGIFGQWVVVVPSLGLVIAKNANDQCALDEPLFLEKVIASVTSLPRTTP